MKASFHVLYWEGGDPLSVSLKSQGAPSLCRQCGGVRRPWRFRLDNLFASIRSCGKEGGVFRKELIDFTCLSPCSAIRYDLRNFHHWLNDENTKALTEENVLGTAIKVDRGLLDSRYCGVHTDDLRDGQWSQWLAKHAAAMQQSAAEKGGRCVALLLDQAGVELLTLDTGGALAERRRHCAPIAKVLLVLGGPSGIQSAIYKGMVEVLKKASLEILEIRLPGGLQHSNVVIADLFMDHDRGFLLPAVEDLLQLGRKQYEEWRAAVQQHLVGIRSEAMQGSATLQQQVNRFRGAPRQQPSVRRKDLDTQVRWTEVLLAPQPQEQPQQPQPRPPQAPAEPQRDLPPEQQLLELLAAHPHLFQQLEQLRPPLEEHPSHPTPGQPEEPAKPSVGVRLPVASDPDLPGEGKECNDCGLVKQDGRPDEHGDWYCNGCWLLFLEEEAAEELDQGPLCAEATLPERNGLGPAGPEAHRDGACAGQQPDGDGDPGDWREPGGWGLGDPGLKGTAAPAARGGPAARARRICSDRPAMAAPSPPDVGESALDQADWPSLGKKASASR